jgi:cytochrome b561
MAAAPPDQRYSATARLLHWTIATLILANIPLGYFSEGIEQAFGASAMWLHKSIGLTVLLLSLARLGWRLGHRPPPLPSTVAGWRVAASRLVHLLLYALMILVPLTGWLRSSASPYALRWFDLFDVPKFGIVPKSAAAHLASRGHELLAWSLIALAAVHIAAALHHELVLRDRLLARMLPFRRAVVRRAGERP